MVFSGKLSLLLKFLLTSNIKQKLSGIYFRAAWNRLLLLLSNFSLKNRLRFSSSLNLTFPSFKLCELNLLTLPPHIIPCRPFATCAMDAALFQAILKLHNFNFFKSEQNTAMADIISKIRSKLSFHKRMLQTEAFSSYILQSRYHLNIRNRSYIRCSPSFACCIFKYIALPGMLNNMHRTVLTSMPLVSQAEPGTVGML